MAENKKIDPELWAALPSSKKYEYWKTFPHTVYITRCGLTPSGMIYLYKEPLTIPDEWLSVTKKLDELNYMDRIIQPRICIDDSVPNGYARIGDQYFELPGAQTYTSNIESDVLGAIAFMPQTACGSSATTFIGTKKAQSEIGLSSGEQRLIKKGLKNESP